MNSPLAQVETGQHHTSSTVVAEEFEAQVSVAAKDVVAEGVVALTLRTLDGSPLPSWAAGAHVDLMIEGVATRQYSLCGDPADRQSYRLGVLRDANGRGSSLYVHDSLHVGDRVRIRGPRNNFHLVAAPRYLFIAGGIGITPIMPMIAKAHAEGAEWRLVYGGRQRASMAFLTQLGAYGDQVSIQPQDEVGLLDLETLLGEPQEDLLIYCCGPEPLLAAVERHSARWPAGALHLERFAPKILDTPSPSESFEVVLDQSELTLTVPADKSVLDVIREAGIHVLSSCGEGTCGTCETPVLEGEVDHRDSILTPEEQQRNDCMMVCVSRSCGARLVLDL